MVVWLFTFSLFGLVQTIQLSERRNPFGVTVADADAERQILLILIGLIAFDIASTSAHRSAITRDRSTYLEIRTISRRRAMTLAWVTIALTPIYIQTVGGVDLFFDSRQSFTDARTIGSGDLGVADLMLAAFFSAAGFLCLFAIWLLRQAGEIQFREVSVTATVTALAMVNIVVNNPIINARYWVAALMIAIALSSARARLPQFQAVFALGFVLLATVAFPYLDYFRYSDGTVGPDSPMDAYLTKTDYGSAQDITNVITLVDQSGHTGGRQLVGVLAFWVPRSAWPEKPTDTNQLIAQHINYPNPNLDSPLWAEGYIDFGWIGAATYLYIFGSIVGRGDRIFRCGYRPTSFLALVFPLLVGYELILLRGSLLQAMGRLSMLILVSIILTTVSRNTGSLDGGSLGARATNQRRSPVKR